MEYRWAFPSLAKSLSFAGGQRLTEPQVTGRYPVSDFASDKEVRIRCAACRDGTGTSAVPGELWLSEHKGGVVI